jgi:hypothetical protein
MIFPGVQLGGKSPLLTVTAGAAADWVVPGATAALRYNATSGVESFHRSAIACARYVSPFASSSAHAARINAEPFGAFAFTVTIPPRRSAPCDDVTTAGSGVADATCSDFEAVQPRQVRRA